MISAQCRARWRVPVPSSLVIGRGTGTRRGVCFLYPDDVTCDPQVRDWLETGDTSVDPNVRKDAYKKALVRIAEQAYSVPMYSLPVYYAFTPDLDFTPHPDEMPRFWEAKWK